MSEMYEALAIAEERRLEIDKLKREKEELEEQVRQLQVKNQQSQETGDRHSNDNMNAVWKAITDLQKETRADMNKLRQDIQKDISKGERTLQKEEKNYKTSSIQIGAPEPANSASIAENSSLITQSQQNSADTVLVATDGSPYSKFCVLSRDASKWIEFETEIPSVDCSVNQRGAVYLNGDIYMHAGGKFSILDKMMKWVSLPDMHRVRYGIENSCLAWNGCIWVCGGMSYNNEKRGGIPEGYDIFGKRYQRFEGKCENCGSVAGKYQSYDTGRCNSSDIFHTTVERYDPKTDKWIIMPDMNRGRADAAAAVWNNKIFICGGRAHRNGTHHDGHTIALLSMEFFDPESEVWTEISNLPAPRSGHCLFPYGDQLIAVGDAQKSLPSISMDNSGKWEMLPAMQAPHKMQAPRIVGGVLDKEIFILDKAKADSQPVKIFNGKSLRKGPTFPSERFRVSFCVVIPQSMADSLCPYKR